MQNLPTLRQIEYAAEKLSGDRLPTGQLLLKKLSGKHRKIIFYHVNGLTAGAIGEIMNMHPVSVRSILRDPMVLEEIKRHIDSLDASVAMKALRRVNEALDADGTDGVLDPTTGKKVGASPDHTIRLRAADMVWRANGRYAPKRDDTIVSAEDVVAKMLEVARERGSASVTISATAGPDAQRVEPIPPELEGTFDETT